MKKGRAERAAEAAQDEAAEAPPQGRREKRENEAADEGHDGPADADADPRDQELADLRDRLLRARADYDNLQRRVERDRDLERERVRARVLEDFLTVYEYGRMAAQEAERHPGPLAEGVRMVVREFDRLLEVQGVRRIGEAGIPFDASRHEAVAEAEGEPGTVVRVVAPGYMLGDRVLRHARVVVATQDPASAPASRAAPDAVPDSVPHAAPGANSEAAPDAVDEDAEE